VNDNSRIAKAWMEIRTPITSVSSSGGSGQVIPHLITLPLYYDGLQWNGSYNFPNAGKYNILYYTQDNQTNDIAPAKNSVVYRQLTNNTAPASFTLTSPNDQEGVSGMFPLTWYEVASPNKITYTLQVATNQNFATVVYKEENIPQAATYMPKDGLKNPQTSHYYCQNGDSFCYWKITAIDSFGAMRESNTRSFTIVSTNALPGIIKGIVRDETTGAPIIGATVAAGSSHYTTLTNGAFIMMLSSGTYTVTATANGYQTKTLANIALASGAVYEAGMSLDSNTPITYSVTPSALSNGTISPTIVQTVNSGATATFTITPASGYRTATPVGGTCPQGTLNVNSYTTGAITGNCNVSASFTLTSDLNGDGKVDLADAIIALQVMAGMQPQGMRSNYTTSNADVNGDVKVGMPELLYVLQKVAGAR
jgi:hypothetical protein